MSANRSNDKEIHELHDLIRQMQIRLGRHYSHKLSEHKLTLQHITLMVILTAHAPMKMNEMAMHLGVTKPAVTHLVDRLEQTGMVERNTCAEDRRATLLTITNTGHTFTDEIRRKAFTSISKAFLELNEEQRKSITSFYKSWAQHFDLEGIDHEN